MGETFSEHTKTRTPESKRRLKFQAYDFDMKKQDDEEFSFLDEDVNAELNRAREEFETTVTTTITNSLARVYVEKAAQIRNVEAAATFIVGEEKDDEFDFFASTRKEMSSPPAQIKSTEDLELAPTDVEDEEEEERVVTTDDENDENDDPNAELTGTPNKLATVRNPQSQTTFKIPFTQKNEERVVTTDDQNDESAPPNPEIPDFKMKLPNVLTPANINFEAQEESLESHLERLLSPTLTSTLNRPASMPAQPQQRKSLPLVHVLAAMPGWSSQYGKDESTETESSNDLNFPPSARISMRNSAMNEVENVVVEPSPTSVVVPRNALMDVSNDLTSTDRNESGDDVDSTSPPAAASAFMSSEDGRSDLDMAEYNSDEAFADAVHDAVGAVVSLVGLHGLQWMNARPVAKPPALTTNATAATTTTSAVPTEESNIFLRCLEKMGVLDLHQSSKNLGLELERVPTEIIEDDEDEQATINITTTAVVAQGEAEYYESNGMPYYGNNDDYSSTPQPNEEILFARVEEEEVLADPPSPGTILFRASTYNDDDYASPKYASPRPAVGWLSQFIRECPSSPNSHLVSKRRSKHKRNEMSRSPEKTQANGSSFMRRVVDDFRLQKQNQAKRARTVQDS